jgi:anti-sigma regulatory factor (Ser/Thr protein kinase)
MLKHLRVGSPEDVGGARDQIAGWLATVAASTMGDQDLVVLGAHELIGNAAVHGGGGDVIVVLTETDLWIIVANEVSGEMPGADAESGRGLPVATAAFDRLVTVYVGTVGLAESTES